MRQDLEQYRDVIGQLNLITGNIKGEPESLLKRVRWQMNERQQLSWLRSRLKDAIDYAEDDTMSGYKNFNALLRECKRIYNKTEPSEITWRNN